MTIERFLMPDPNPPIDEEEIREAVWELLFSRAPPALVRVVGKQVYHRWATACFASIPVNACLAQWHNVAIPTKICFACLLISWSTSLVLEPWRRSR